MRPNKQKNVALTAFVLISQDREGVGGAAEKHKSLGDGLGYLSSLSRCGKD